MTARIYLDHAATTPLRPEAKAAMEEGFAIWANPSSPYAEGRAARRALEDARGRVKAALGWEGEVIFTSGASEAAAIALSRTKASARLVSAVEHDCILQAAPDAERLPVRADGVLDLDALREAVQRERPLVAVQQVNSETGAVQPLGKVAEIVHEAGGLLLADAAQGAGKLALPVAADMILVAAHKLGGPVGVGALLLRDYAMLEPVGGHERGYRRGTENMPGALGFAAGLEACADGYLQPGVTESIDRLAGIVRDASGEWLGDRLAETAPTIAALAMPGMSATAQVLRFDMAGFAVSQGSACSSGTMKTSHVLQALAVPEELADRVIRVSFGWDTVAEDVDTFAEAWRSLS